MVGETLAEKKKKRMHLQASLSKDVSNSGFDPGEIALLETNGLT